MARDIPKGYKEADKEYQEFKDSDEIRDFIKNYCKKCREMYSKSSESRERCTINKRLSEAIADGGPEYGFSYWADAFVALEPEKVEFDRKIHCFDWIKIGKIKRK